MFDTENMKKPIVFILFLIPLFTAAQTDILILKKRGAHVRTYTPGSEITFRTVYDQWFTGKITSMRHDTIWMNHDISFDYKEIKEIRILTLNFGNTLLPAAMMVAGGGNFVVGAVNGMIRKDAVKDWYTKSGVIIGSGLLVGGFLLTKTRKKTYHLGGKYKLDYLQITFDKKGSHVERKEHAPPSP